MTIPTYDEMMLPLMKLLKEQSQAIKVSEAANILAERAGLSEIELSQKMRTGNKTVFYDRVGWAKTYLVKAGLVEQPKRGLCQLSDQGKIIDLKSIYKIDKAYLMQFDSFVEFISPKKSENLENDLSDKEDSYQQTRTPIEQLEENSELLRKQLKTELLDIIKNNSPNFFEQLVVDLLVAMGYGGSHQDAATAFKKSHDGGIDGVISEDRLGLDKIYIQAKRWGSTTVTKPEIQQFKGALADQVAKKGVFITTSTFSEGAKESAQKSGIVLIDGDKLTSLMIEFGLGVQIERSFHIYKIDQDRFDEDNL